MGQLGTHIGINAAPLAIGTLDIHAEERLSNTISLHLGAGFRTHEADRREPRLRILQDFYHLSNTATYLSIGIRLFNPETGIDYPYVQFSMTSAWYSDKFLSASGQEEWSRAFTWGNSATIGYVINVDQRWQIDLGLQMGYSPPRRDLLSYYLPGLGYSTFGLGQYGVNGGHVQPVATIKYKIRVSKRERLHRDL